MTLRWHVLTIASAFIYLTATPAIAQQYSLAEATRAVYPHQAVRFRLADYELPSSPHQVVPVADEFSTTSPIPNTASTSIPKSIVTGAPLNSTEFASEPSLPDFLAKEGDALPANSSGMDSVIATPQNESDDDCCLPRIWASAEYVLWFPDGANLPALVTTSVPGTTQDQAARLSSPTTSVLFGSEELNSSSRSGAKFSLGGWLNQCNMFGVELNLLVLGNDETTFSAADEFEILGRPFFNVLNSEHDAKLINFPGLTSGQIDVTMKSEFYTGEALLRKRTAGWGASQFDWYLGYRHARLVDDLRIVEDASVLSGPAAGAQLVLSDQFRTRNTFHGVDLGVRVAALVRPLLEVEVSSKVAVGTTYSETHIVGFSRTNAGGTTTTSDFGLLTQSTNTGLVEEDTFSTVTEFGVTGKRMFRPGLSLTVGYTLFFWHDIVRAGDQIDSAINTSQFPPGVLINELRPIAPNLFTNFWAHGFHIGFEYLF